MTIESKRPGLSSSTNIKKSCGFIPLNLLTSLLLFSTLTCYTNNSEKMNNLFPIATWSILIYGLVVLLGGVMGYLKAKSQVSLLSGVGSGIALLVAWFVCQQIPSVGLGLATLLALVLFIVFIIRFLKTRAFMPAGLMMASSLAATVLFLLGLLSTAGLLT